MSRISRYQDSVNRFITKRIGVSNNNLVKEIVMENIKNNDFVLPIILLTILNNQSKQNNMSVHGYYMATGIEYLYIIFKLLDNKSYHVDKMGYDKYYNAVTTLMLYVMSSLQSNLESIQSSNKDKSSGIFNISFKNINDKILTLMEEIKFEFTDSKKKTDLIKYHFKDVESAQKKWPKLKQIKKEQFFKYINTKIGSITQITIITGWLLGGGDEKMIPVLEKLGNNLAVLLKLSNDFENLEKDFNNSSDNITTNFILNYGIQEAFELFTDSKQKFIEGALLSKIYTSTLKEVIDIIESKIDPVIDQTSPDLKSTYSSYSKSKVTFS